MRESALCLPPELVAELFPFHIALGRDLTVLETGPVIGRLYQGLVPGSPLDEHFLIEQPPIELSFDAIREQARSLFILRSLSDGVKFRGQMAALDEPEALIFFCSPWLTTTSALKELGLALEDFAVHDPITDLLFTLQAAETALADARKLTAHLTRQRAELHRANLELLSLHDVSRALAVSTSLAEAGPDVLAALGERWEWELGGLWRIDRGAGVFRSESTWAREGFAAELEPSLRKLTFPTGAGPFACILGGGKPLWISDLAGSGALRSAPPALRVRLRSAVAVPIGIGGDVSGMFQLFSFGRRSPDERLLDMLGEVGTKAGEFVLRRRTEEILRAKEAAEAASELKSSFLANMSHEIRTPMAAILGYAELLRERLCDDRDGLEELGIIERSGEHLLALLNDILDLSKIEAGQLEVESVPCSPSEILEEVVAVMAVRAKEKGIEIKVSYETPLPRHILSDPTRIRQVLINLVGNAVKFTDRGSVSIAARALGAKNGFKRLEYVVADTGIGIPDERLSEIFKPFSQIDPSASRKHGGTGLGLSISWRLAQLLGGEFSVESKTGRGSVFTFALRSPVPAGALAGGAGNGASPRGPSREPGAGSSQTG